MDKVIAGSDLTTHISFLVCPEIDEICRPLFIHTLIKVFEYSRIHPDGSRAELSNHAVNGYWYSYYKDKIKQQKKSLDKVQELPSENSVSCDENKNKKDKEYFSNEEVKK